MGPFALPVPGYRFGIHRAKKDKKRDDEQDGEVAEPSPERDLFSSQLPSGSINPRSYSPDTLHQLAVAGLEPEDDVPSATYPLFPHRPLPSTRTSDLRRLRETRARIPYRGDPIAAERRADAAAAKLYAGCLRHLSTLTAVVHRCLAEGDIPRAKRAFGLLVSTKDVDIRQAGLWAVGSEILMRDGEADQRQRQTGYQERRWGTAANVDKVRDYFETLIQQHPHDVHRPHQTSALDFWPALFGIEIWSLDAGFRAAFLQLRAEEGDENDEDEMAYEDDEDDEQQQRKREVARAARDELRRGTRDAAEHIARRMDQTMENAAFGASRVLLRARGNLSLYIADMCLPSRLVDEDEDSRAREGLSLNQIEDLLRQRAESADEYGALSRRRDELEKARGFFRKILDGGGEVDESVRKFLFAEEDEGHHDAGYDDDDAW
ncbi:hypothetical protein F4818DRAFT_400286 [Hypoxylon cercidicola]|nr:hypothetical protein F4818DRAFT_400286 [Hypoxylon cercidicola]